MPEQTDLTPGKRISIIGATGSGKTTLGQRLEGLLGFPYLELDSIHWLPGWHEVDLETMRAQVAEQAARECWIMDGNYSKVRDLVWQRADTVIWLDYPIAVNFWRLLVRTLQRVVRREKLWNDNTEDFRTQFLTRDSLFVWLLRSYPKNRKRFPQELQQPQHAHLKLLRFSSPGALQRWLRWLREQQGETLPRS